MPNTIKKVCKIIPVAKPKTNLKAVLKPCDKLVTSTNMMSGPGVIAKIADANKKLRLSDNVNKNLFFYLIDMFAE